MAEGAKRRTVAQDRLATKQGMEPVRLSGPGVSAPPIQQIAPSVSGQIYKALGQWASEKLKEVAVKDHEKQLMDGAMASVQGDTMEQLELDGGDKWALQGYRVMTAQTISSALTATRKQQIVDADYALDPEQFRSKYVEQLGGAVEGQDPKIARLIREQMTAAMPELVAQHTLANTQFLERKNYDAVLQSVDIISRDAQGVEALISIAQGLPGSASAGLSKARLSSAVTEGVVLAFRNDNPRAYDLLKATGVFDDYSTDEINRIEGAKQHYDSRLKAEYNEEFFSEENRISEQVRSGKMTEWESVEATSENFARRGINFENADARTAYNAARDPQRLMGMTRAAAMKKAVFRKDWGALGAASMSIITKIESDNDPYAVGPVIEFGASAGTTAKGLNQVTDATAAKPGWGIKPSDGTPEDRARVGRDYWSMNVKRYEGDLEAAAIGYHAGPGNADEWIKTRDYSTLPQPEASRDYWRKFQKEQADQEFPLASDKWNEMMHQEALAKKAFEVEAWSKAQPRINEITLEYTNGTKSEKDWLAETDAIYEQYGILKTKGMVDHQIKVTNDMAVAVAKADVKRVDQSKKDEFARRMVIVNQKFDDILSDPTNSENDMAQAMSDAIEERLEIINELDIPLVDAKNGSAIDAFHKQYQGALDAVRKERVERGRRDRAYKDGTVSDLSPTQQAKSFDETIAHAAQPIVDAFDRSGQKDADRAVYYQGLDETTLQVFATAGVVDARHAASESALILRGLEQTNKDGEKVANPKAAAALLRAQRMKEISPSVYRSYLSPEAMVIAEAVEYRMGKTGIIEDAMLDVQRNFTDTTKVKEDAFVESAQVNLLMEKALKKYQQLEDIGLRQAWFNSDADTSDAFRVLATEQVKRIEAGSQVEFQVDKQLRRLWKISPFTSPDVLVPLAVEEMKRHSAMIGGSFITVEGDIPNMMFGSREAQFTKAGIVNDVILFNLRSPAMQEKYPFLDNSSWIEFLPQLAQSLASNLGWGTLTGDLTLGMSAEDAFEAGHRRVRPYDGFVSANNKDVYIKVRLDNGTMSPEIPINWQDFGAYWMDNKVRRNDPEDE